MTIKILVVDDEVELAELIAFDLEFAGYKTTCAHSGQEAYKYIHTETFDLIISDIRMPKGDGITLLQQVKHDYPNLPVILITGFTDVTEQAAVEMGAIAVLRKPDDLNHIAAFVSKMLPLKPTG